MGVAFAVRLYAPDSVVAERAARAAFQRIADLETALSDYRADSDLNRLHGGYRAGEWTPISPTLARAMRTALELAERTDGAFDPTVGPLTALWRESRRTGRLPEPEVLAAARAKVGYRKVRVDGDRIRIEASGMRFDFGGIGKGMACDAALEALSGEGVTQALVEGGGDIAASGPPPGETGWRVEVPDLPLTVRLAHAALSSSGDRYQFVQIGGRRYSHIVDPTTGLGLPPGRSSTLVGPQGAVTDALATAECVRPGVSRNFVGYHLLGGPRIPR